MVWPSPAVQLSHKAPLILLSQDTPTFSVQRVLGYVGLRRIHEVLHNTDNEGHISRCISMSLRNGTALSHHCHTFGSLRRVQPLIWDSASVCSRALAASAPIWQFTNMTSCGVFYKIVTNDFTSYGFDCSESIRKSWSSVDNVSSTGMRC